MFNYIVKDVLSKDIVKLKSETKVSEAARIMAEEDADCIVVIDNSLPEGIVTASDFLRRVVALGKNANELILKDIMSSPVLSIEIDGDLEEASEMISESGVKRLVVVDGTEVVGIVTSLNILEIGPLRGEESREVGPGVCEICGEYFEVLEEVNGKYVCLGCKEVL